MTVNNPGSVPFAAVQDLGVVIKEIEPNCFHVGALYKLDDCGPKVCHLLWHMVLHGADLPDGSYDWIQCGLDPIDRKVLSPAFAAIDHLGQLPISYSTIYDGVYFDAGTLRYSRTSPGEGLTCATFIMAIFDALRFPLLSIESWRTRPSDASWRAHVLRQLEMSHSPPFPEHLEAQRETIERPRFRPEEVAAGVASTKPPLSFEVAIANGAEIIAGMRRLANSP